MLSMRIRVAAGIVAAAVISSSSAGGIYCSSSASGCLVLSNVANLIGASVDGTGRFFLRLGGPHFAAWQAAFLSGACAAITVDDVTISRPGSYCLHSDLMQGIDVRSNDVSIDLQGHCIRSGDGPKGSESAVYIEHGRQRITVRNGCITGFMYGVLTDDGVTGVRSSHIWLDKLVLEDNFFRGAKLYATNASVTNSTVRNIGGSAVYHDAYAIGIEIEDNHCLIANNVIRDVYGAGLGEGVGISIPNEDQSECLVEGNMIANSRLSETGSTFALWF